MKTSFVVSLATLSLAVPSLSAAAEPVSPHTFTGNVALVSDYVFRGISQTAHKPAIQGGFDYSNANGLYVGTWASNVSWVTDNILAASNSMELDLYGGYKGTLSGDLTYDLGVLRYVYPGSNTSAPLKPDTTELYAALTYKWLTLKYSRSSSALFGWVEAGTAAGKTSGSGYLDATGTFDMGNGMSLIAHAGHQSVKGLSVASYTDYKLGVTKDLGVGVIGLSVTNTNSKGDCAAFEAYCWGGATGKTYDAGKSTVFVSFSKSL